MGRRRRRVVRIVKKKLPTVFVCPRCGEEAVRVSIDKTSGKATVLCALCNLKNEFQAHPLAQPIDVYSYFTDVFYGVPNPRAIIPREREISKIIEPETSDEGETAAAAPPLDTTETPMNENESIESKAPSDVNPPVENETPSLEAEQTTEAITSESNPVEESGKSRQEEENEPFADILSNNTDKKRYSTRPIAGQERRQQQEQQTQEESSQTSEQSA